MYIIPIMSYWFVFQVCSFFWTSQIMGLLWLKPRGAGYPFCGRGWMGDVSLNQEITLAKEEVVYTNAYT